MDFKFNENERMIRELTREFAQNEILPQIEYMEREKHPPEGLYQKLCEIGILGTVLPEEYGGLDLNYSSFLIAIEEISRVSPGIACSVLTSVAAMEAINMFGTQEQRQRCIPKGISGEAVLSFAFTEAATGSDPKQLTTTMKKEGDHYILNGTKRFITNSSYKGPMLVFAIDTDSGRCTGFIIDKFCEGYSLSSQWEKVGFHESPVYDVFLDNVRVEEKDILGQEGDGFRVLLQTSAYGKLGQAASALGVIGQARELAVKYVKEKMHRGEPITKFQQIQLKIAHLSEKYISSKWMVYSVGAMADDITDLKAFQAETALTKGYVSDLAVQACAEAMAAMGAYGVTEEYGIERLMRSSLIYPVIEGVSDVQRILYAGLVLK